MSIETTMPYKYLDEKPPYKEEWYLVEREDGTIEWENFDPYFDTFSNVIGWDYLYPGKEQELEEKYKKIKEEVKRLLSKIMIRYNVDEEYIRSLLQEEV